ncbi:hypothetical protein E5S67_05230 [Microcoleus sp. IPMA8]|uniref:Uncharacterized protein n=1 Tax=Microcoleus asticus IPMA8 TaxID=2563858 RepID=A0ABX2D4B2_9CYAN|nr:hypothetical protein [Microcoleus asticus IPMA8]
MNAATFDEASEIDYLMTNVDFSTVTGEWIAKTYLQRNGVEVFYREALRMVRTQRISSQR